MSDNIYQNGKIYKLFYIKDPSFVYVGSTIQKLVDRWNHHIQDSKKCQNQKVYKFINNNGGFDNFDILEIESCACSEKEELEKREYEIATELKNKGYNMLNSYCSKEEEKEIKKIILDDIRVNKLSNEDVLQIYELKGEISTYKIAELFNVGTTAIKDIHNKKAFQEITKNLPDKSTFAELKYLDKETVIKIYNLKSEKTVEEISKMFDVGINAIYKIHAKQTHYDILKDLPERKTFRENQYPDDETIIEIYNRKGEKTTRELAEIYNTTAAIVQKIHNKKIRFDLLKDLPEKKNYKEMKKEIKKNMPFSSSSPSPPSEERDEYYLSKEDVIKIYMLKGEKSVRDIAKEFKIDESTVYKIHNKEHYSDILNALPDKKNYTESNKLDKDIVIEIFNLKGNLSTYDIADKYNTTPDKVQRIHNRKLYTEYTASLPDRKDFNQTNKLINPEKIIEIFKQKGKGKTIKQVAEDFGVGRSTVQGIWSGDRHSHITKNL